MMIRTPDDLRQAFKIQIAALEASCASYDKGSEWEAIRMAVSVHLLVHDAGKRNLSLLTQINLKKKLKFISSAHLIDGKNMMESLPLVSLKFGDGPPRYVAKFDSFPQDNRFLSFEDWWERDRIFQTGRDAKTPNFLTRKRLIFALRNKEGGAHYDPFVEDPGYNYVSKTPIFTIVSSDGKSSPMRNLELASMRQIAWELLRTIEDSAQL